jgi:uracil-DNA glycosylase family 4
MSLDLFIIGSSNLTTHPDKYDFYYRNGCIACPFKNQPKVEPYGAKKPVVYLLGEAAGKTEIDEGRPFVGVAGEMLRKHIPKRWYDDRLLRWNNCVKARPPGNRTPLPAELAACRQYLEADIVASRPAAIFGFGAVPLGWFGLADAGITIWAGRYVPVQVRDRNGNTHTCWYFPMLHPSYVSRMVNESPSKSRAGYTTEIEFAFNVHMERAFDLVDRIEEIGQPVVHTRDMAMEGIEIINHYTDDTVQRIVRFIEGLYSEKVAGFDYETNALRPYNKSTKILSAALSGQHGTLAWPIEHREARWTPKQLATIEDVLQRFLIEAPCIKAVHNAAFEIEWSTIFHGRKTARTNTWACTMSQAYVLDERQASVSTGGPMSLEWLCKQYFGFSIKSLNQVDRADLDNVPLKQVLPYNGCDAKYHRLLCLKQRNRIKREGLEDIYVQQMRRMRAATLTQVKGLPVDHMVSEKLLAKYTKLRDAAEAAIEATEAAKEYRTRRGGQLKPGSPHDVSFLLKHVLPPEAVAKARDRDGQIVNATEATLTKVNHKIIKPILAWRKAHKVLSTYIYPVLSDSPHVYDDGLLHPQTRTTTVVTWRTSSDNPNYQNFPKKDGDRREVRGQIARKGYKVVSFDYAGIQARNVAMESRDPELVKAFNERYDIHSDWTKQLVDIYPRWVKEGVKQLAANKDLFKAYRNRTKNEFVFASLFGARATSIAYYLGVPEEIGEKLQGMFWDRFGGVFGWHAKLLKFYRKHGYVTGLSGWRRRAPVSPNELINTPIQSDESAIVLDAMCRLSEMDVWALQPNGEVHDDLFFVWPNDKVEEYGKIVLKTMLYCPFEWAQIVPLGVEMSVGEDWHTQTSIGEYFSNDWDGNL